MASIASATVRSVHDVHLPDWPPQFKHQLINGKEFPYFGSMITSKLTTKLQTTIPQPVRAALGLKQGDEIVYEIDGDVVLVRKAGVELEEDPFALFDEWNSEADRKGYADF